MSETKDRIAVLGAGQMGNGIAHVFAQSGFPVTMIDISRDALARGRDTISKNLDRQVKKGATTAEEKDKTLGRIATADSLDAITGAAIVIEAVTEQRDLKFKIFGDLDRLADAQAILASNTSSISITEIAGRTKRAELVLLAR
jgi:3-hydroxybutyryl-CoA dehydrogenase